MLKKIFEGYKAVFGSFLRLLTLIFLCIVLAVIVVYPLWKIATSNAKLYSIIFSIIFFSLVIGLITSKTIILYKKSPKKCILTVSRRLVLIFGLSLFVFFVFKFSRFFALISLLLTFILYGVIAFGLTQDEKNGV